MVVLLAPAFGTLVYTSVPGPLVLSVCLVLPWGGKKEQLLLGGCFLRTFCPHPFVCRGVSQCCSTNCSRGLGT